MTTEAQPTPCTAEQKAAWSALHDRMQELSRERDNVDRMIVAFMVDHVTAGAMMPTQPLGLPSQDALEDYRRACEHAATSARLKGEWYDLYAEAQAHPYTAEVKARQEAQA